MGASGEAVAGSVPAPPARLPVGRSDGARQPRVARPDSRTTVLAYVVRTSTTARLYYEYYFVSDTSTIYSYSEYRYRSAVVYTVDTVDTRYYS